MLELICQTFELSVTIGCMVVTVWLLVFPVLTRKIYGLYCIQFSLSANEHDNCIVTIKLFPIETFTFKKIMWARDYVSSLKSILIKIVSVRTFGSTLQVTRLRDGAVSQLWLRSLHCQPIWGTNKSIIKKCISPRQKYSFNPSSGIGGIDGGFRSDWETLSTKNFRQVKLIDMTIKRAEWGTDF